MRLLILVRTRQRFYGFCIVSVVLLVLFRSGVFNIFKQSVQHHASMLSIRGQKQVYTFNNKWELVSICKPYSAFRSDKDFQLTKFTSNAGTISIFTHNSERDYVSREITTKGAFNAHLINEVVRELRYDLEVSIIDIGTNVGQFCLAAALIGRQCIGIDAAKSNIQHACASVEYHKFGSKITLIHNALSDDHDQTNIQINGNGDFGAIYVDADDTRKLKQNTTTFQSKGDHSVKINSMKMDDLLTLPDMPRFYKVFLVMDVEGFEHYVLSGAHKFFNSVDVRGVIMDWNWHIGRNTSEVIEKLFSNWGFVPLTIDKKVYLNSPSDEWPHDILWYPYSRYDNLLD